MWPEGAHALTNMATPLGELALRRTTSWITAVLEAAPSPVGDGTQLFVAPGVDPSHLVNTVR